MSIRLMSRIWEDVELKRPQQTVLLAMADHADDEGSNCFPSVDRIAWKTGYKPRAVTDIIRDLKIAGILVEVQAARAGKPTEYKIDLSAAPPKVTFEEWRALHGRHRSRGAENAPVHSDGGGVQSHVNETRETAPEPSVEPSESTTTAPPTPPQDLVTTRCVQILKRTKGLDKDEETLADYLATLQEDFPLVDAVEVCKEYETWHLDGNRTKNYLTRLRNFFKTASNRLSVPKEDIRDPDYRRNGHQRREDAPSRPRGTSARVQDRSDSLEAYYANNPGLEEAFARLERGGG